MKIIFCGDRNWTDKNMITLVMSLLKRELGEFTVIEGDANGADKLSGAVAKFDLNLPVEVYPANWGKHGKSAGQIRNTQMLIEGKADGTVAFHNDILASKGTRNMILQTRRAGRPTWISDEGPEGLKRFVVELKKGMI